MTRPADGFTEEGFSTSARYWQGKAFEAFLGEEKSAALTFAAIALEHVHKAYLCSRSPALLVELKSNSPDSLYHLLGLQPASRPRTIGALESMKRARRLNPFCSSEVDPLVVELVGVRDGVLHAGIFGESQYRELFIAFIRTADEAWDALGADQDSRWGRYTDLAASLVIPVRPDASYHVSVRVASATLSYLKRFESIPDSEHEAVRTALRLPRLDWDPAAVAEHVGGFVVKRHPSQDFGFCPACRDDEASYFGSIEVDWEPVFHPDDPEKVLEHVPSVKLYPSEFACGICKLQLRNREELRAAGLDSPWDLGISTFEWPDDDA